MKIFFHLSLCLVGVTSMLSAFLEPIADVKEHLLVEIESIAKMLEVHYAPLEWKKIHLGWDLAKEVALAKEEILGCDVLSEKDAQRVLRKFFKSLCDFHVGILFHSTEMSSLPFKVEFAGCRCFVTAVNKRDPSYQKVPLEIGDEILSFDGKSPMEALLAFEEQEMYRYDDRTSHALAASFLTLRIGSLAHRIPQGEIAIQAYSFKDKSIRTYRTEWFYVPEKIAHHWSTESSNSEDLDQDTPSLIGEHPFFLKRMETPLVGALKFCDKFYSRWGANVKDSFKILGGVATHAAKSIALQSNIKILRQMSSSNYDAFTYQTQEGAEIGYLRLPHYSGKYQDALEFGHIISQMEGITDALVIDQTNNPGGYFFYMYALASMLTTKPLKTHPHQQTLSHKDVAFALQNLKELGGFRSEQEAAQRIGSTINGYHVGPDALKSFRQHFAFIVSQWEEGRWISTPNPLMGISEVKPHPSCRYTKPIVFLTNGLSFSCGDFMPAMLQDNKRALILGTKTAGAGGYVLKAAYPSRFGVESYSYTGSIALRTDLETPLENLGVTPDIIYELTPEDYQNNFSGYYKAIESAVNQLLAERPKNLKKAKERN